MPQYDFQSPGANAATAIKQILLEREMQKRYDEQQARQAQLDQMNQKNIEAQAAERAAATARADKQTRFSQAKDIANMAGGDEVATPESAAMLQEAGLGGRLEDRYKPGTPGIGVIAQDALPPDAQVGETKQMIKPGFQYEQAREAEKARAAQAHETDMARKQQALEVAQMRSEDARLRADERAQAAREAADLRRELQNNQIAASNANAEANRSIRTDAANEKAADKLKTEKASRASALAVADSMRDAIKDLATPDANGNLVLNPGTAKIVGGSRIAPGLPEFLGGSGVLPGVMAEHISGSPSADARAALKQIVSQRVVELMAEMKRQSRTGATGFGALSEKELAILQSASARLDVAQSDKAFTEALQDLNNVIDNIYNQPEPGSGSVGPMKSKYQYSIEGTESTPSSSPSKYKTTIE